MHKNDRLNVLLVMADHWRSDWIGVLGQDYVKTPNIDRIAESGLVFTRAVCNSPQCAPSRISFTTGIYPNRLGAYQNNTCLYPAVSNQFGGLLPSFYNHLQANGYRTGLVGKADLCKGRAIPGASEISGGSDSGYPLAGEIGIEDSFETVAKWEENDGGYLDLLCKRPDLQQQFLQERDKRLQAGLTADAAFAAWALPTEYYWDQAIAAKGIELLEQYQGDSPWNLNLHFQAPHPPYDAPKEYLEMYEDVDIPEPISCDIGDKSAMIQRLVAKREDINTRRIVLQRRKHMLAMLTAMDDCIGQVVAKLKQIGQYENTAIILTSDHGDMTGDFGLWNKNFMYNGSVRVPLIISYPGMKRTGFSQALTELVDVYPTILDLAGIKYEPERLDGMSLLPILEAKTEEHKQFQFSEFGDAKQWPFAERRMVSDGKYKLIHHWGVKELYDVEHDPNETVNLAAAKPEMTEHLSKVLDQYSRAALPPQFGRKLEH